MWTYKITIDYSSKSELLEEADSAPKCSLATARIAGNRGFFRIDLTIIGPKPEEAESYLSLGAREVHDLFEALTDSIIPLEEKLRG